jgi:transcriptional regulator with XRE-family HTH domain
VKSEEKFLIAFGKNLVSLRKAKNISQEQLAYDADLSLSSISKIERGVMNVSITKAYRIAQVLKVSHKELFNFD